RRLRDRELAILDREPAPAGAELSDARLDEILLELGDRTDVGNDLLFELAGNLVAAAALLHPLPEVDVVIVLGGIVEETGILAERAFDDVLDRLVLPLGALGQIIAIGHISRVMLVVMVFEGLARHVGSERVVGVGEYVR